ncbi:MAG: DUF3179 domain-containing (seleno)protein [Saprospiraceae bacterium]
MRKFFYLGILGLILFEIANVYFIMPIPGSQEMNSISLAYFLHSHQWLFRIGFGLIILAGLRSSWDGSKILVLLSFAVIGVVAYMVNYKMVADHMFYQPKQLRLMNAAENKVDQDKLILGVEYNNESKAYPIQFLGFHHQVRDSIGGKPIMVTYCTVCRTGRVFEPLVNGKEESFRLVGMDHFNAMFEDKSTKSWWRQENGEAVAGELEGQALPEFPSSQSTLGNWLKLHPNSLIMQPDSSFQSEYDSLANYEGGQRPGKLTRRDTLYWQPKSWVAGLTVDNVSKAYDWNELIKNQIINDQISAQPIVVFLADDHKSLFAYKRNAVDQKFSIRNDTLSDGAVQYNLSGHPYQDSIKNLEPLQIYQEYWHSWKQFHPETLH